MLKMSIFPTPCLLHDFNKAEILNPFKMSFNIELMVKQPDCSTLIQNQANLTNQGMTFDPNVAMEMVVASIMFTKIMQQAGRWKNANFQHV